MFERILVGRGVRKGLYLRARWEQASRWAVGEEVMGKGGN